MPLYAMGRKRKNKLEVIGFVRGWKDNKKKNGQNSKAK